MYFSLTRWRTMCRSLRCSLGAKAFHSVLEVGVLSQEGKIWGPGHFHQVSLENVRQMQLWQRKRMPGQGRSSELYSTSPRALQNLQEETDIAPVSRKFAIILIHYITYFSWDIGRCLEFGSIYFESWSVIHSIIYMTWMFCMQFQRLVCRWGFSLDWQKRRRMHRLLRVFAIVPQKTVNEMQNTHILVPCCKIRPFEKLSVEQKYLKY